MPKRIPLCVLSLLALTLVSFAQDAKHVKTSQTIPTVDSGSSFVFGSGTTATPASSYAIGEGLQAMSFCEMAIGRFNDLSIYSTMSQTLWQANDTVFVVGIGMNALNRANAFEIFKSGRITIPKRQGDIFMGEFGKPEDSGL